MSELKELLEFVSHERADIRKAAAQGLAQHSRDNSLLVTLVCTDEAALNSLVALLSDKHAPVLGEVLTTLVNLAADAAAAEAIIGAKTVSRVMRLLDNLARSDTHSAAQVAVWTEMCLMLLNNLTASSVPAVHELLQIEDEDLRGFHIGKLKTLFDRSVPPEVETPAAAAASEADSDVPAVAAPVHRDIRHWHLQIVLNVTRTPHGSAILVQDDDWMPELISLMGPDSLPSHRHLATQTLRNCSGNKRCHEPMVAAGCCGASVRFLHEGYDRHPEATSNVCDILSSLITTTSGCQALDSINAKKLLNECHSRLPPDQSDIITRQVIPFLDDVQDVFVVQGDGDGA